LEEQGNFFKSLRTGTMRRWRSTTTPEDRAPGPVKKITLTDEERKRYESM
jgi:hypothetical protein